MSMHRHRLGAFTLIELVVVIVVLAILGGVAIMRYHDVAPQARLAADSGSLAAINEALNQKYLANRMNSAGSASWITSPNQVAAVMHWDELPHGIRLSNNQFVDQRGNSYAFEAESATNPARIVVAAASAGASAGASGSSSAASGSGAAGGTGEGAGDTSGAGIMPQAAVLLIVALPWCSRPRRGDPA